MFTGEKRDKALEKLFDSFKNYQETGDSRARTLLKYVILSGSQINYSDTREAKVYKDDHQIIAINSLRTAFEQNDMLRIQEILADKDSQILDDPFITQYLDDLLRRIRLNVLIAKVKPYKSVSIEFLAKQLNVSFSEIMVFWLSLSWKKRSRGDRPAERILGDGGHQTGSGSQKHAAGLGPCQSAPVADKEGLLNLDSL